MSVYAWYGTIVCLLVWIGTTAMSIRPEQLPIHREGWQTASLIALVWTLVFVVGALLLEGNFLGAIVIAILLAHGLGS